MKTKIFGYLCPFIIIFSIITLNAQLVFPVSMTVEFVPSVDHSTLLRYEYILNGGNPTTISLTSCTASLCTSQFTVPNQGPHTFTLFAVNDVGRSVPVTLNFGLNQPAPPGVITIKITRPSGLTPGE